MPNLSLTAGPTGNPIPVSSGSSSTRLHLVAKWAGRTQDLAGTTIFLRGRKEIRRQLLWSHWHPTDAFGGCLLESVFCPGRQGTIEEMFATRDGRSRSWGGFRSGSTVFSDLTDSFVILPGSFVSAWQPLDPTSPVVERLGLAAAMQAGTGEKYYLATLELPERGDRQAFASGLGLDFGCFIATNRNELTLFKHTAGNRVVDFELPEPIDSILSIVRVADARGRKYLPRFDNSNGSVERSYTLEERGDRLLLWFDFSSQLEAPPESLTVTYAVTEGTGANGIEYGKIATLYESHPGIKACRNVTDTGGAVPAKTNEQIMTEVSTRLRGRDRALTYADITSWTKTFDPRIQSVECENGVQRTRHGVRKCIVVGVYVARTDFYADDEMNMLKERIGSFLKERSPINTQYQVEIIAR